MSGIVGSKLNIRGSGLVASYGTDGQHLLSAGAGVSNVFETAAAGGAWTKLSHTTISANSAYVEFEPFSATYEDFKIVFVKLHPATDSQELRMRYNIAGSEHIGDYVCGVMGRSSNASTYYDDFNTANQFHLYTTNQPGNEADESGSLEVTITAVHNTTFFKHAYWIGVFATDTNNDIQPIMGGGNIQKTSAVTGCRFFFNSGNIQGGEATLYGRKIT